MRVENKAGVLARVAGLFARRGFNIESLAVAPYRPMTEFSRITIVVVVASNRRPLEQVVKQLDKLINVVEIRELDPAHSGRARADDRRRVTAPTPEARRRGASTSCKFSMPKY